MAKRTDRERRIGILLPVEYERLGQRVTGMAGNISRHGIYVRTDAFMPIGEIVELGIALPRGMTVKIVARAVHSLEARTAHSLGRFAGIGFKFIDQETPEMQAVAEMIDEVAGEVSAPLCDSPVRLVVANSDPRLLDRMATVLGEAGYAVEAATNGLEAYGICLERAPEIVIACEDMPIMGGHALAEQLAQDKLDVSVLFPKKPFTDEDLCAQVARMISERRARPGLRASLREMSLGALLSFLEQSRKTGLVTAKRGKLMVQLCVREGRIVDVTRKRGVDPRAKLLDLLDWTDGVFEFHAEPVEGEDQVQWSTTKLLMEHARTRDELMEAPTAVREISAM